ncbi:ATP-dependent RNA helicase DEAH13 [Punica granatum]|uniref:RNA helicase n=1 Tax=Punica granatum TaxID=22663 RepID=A0A6P8BNY0_PUNGR|nr:ATP-dependent RNA helicase DEAH13 [Punica granatum]
MREVAMEMEVRGVDLEREGGRLSSVGDDSNAVILPGKKRKNAKGKSQDPRNAKKKIKSPVMSKSRKRKLKKPEEEKRNKLLLSQSLETLEKYKIPETAYSILQSTRNIGRAETKCEKRSKVVQFSKAGLRAPYDQDFGSRDEDDEANSTSETVCNNVHGRDRQDRGEKKGQIMTAQVPVLPVTHIVHSITSAPADTSNPSPMLHTPDVRDSDGARGRVDERPKAVDKESSPPNSSGCGTFSAPTVVHVLRPKGVEDTRKDLPIVMMEQEIMEAINYHSTVIICGETGCGKTTQVPQFLYEAGFGSNCSTARTGIVGVTQPRRVAVLATAKRVAYELGLRLGKEVGFQVRYDKKIGDHSSIKFMTDGILLREVQNDFLLRRYSVIILDEAHERSLNTDILIGMLSRVIKLRQDLFEKQQKMLLLGQNVSPESKIYPLKLVLMSATLRVEDFSSGKRLFRYPPPVIEVPTRQYPVTIHFSKRTEIVDYIGQAYKKVISIHKRLPPGGVLVFVTGQREVEYLCQKLRKASRELVMRSNHRNAENESDAVPEMNLVEGIDMNEIDEAYQIGDNHQQTDRFSSYDDDQYDIREDESDVPNDSESESDFETVDANGVSGDDKTSADGNLSGVLNNEGTLSSLKAAFDALAGKVSASSNSNTANKTDPVALQEVPDAVNPNILEEKGGKNGASNGPMRVLPLYAMLPTAAQLHVFQEVNEGERLVIVATNVAETSLTIPGIKYVVDTGREKVKNYNSSNGMETYEIKWISKASAAQRAGRAGRTGPGHCYRLYSSAVFHNIFPDFALAEISKIPVDGVVLLMKSMGIDKVANFPFPTTPEKTSLLEAEQCLKVLEALDSNGKLTTLGKAMAHYPMSPRHSRMLLTVIQIMRTVGSYTRANLVLGFAVAAAAALSLPNPFLRPIENSQTQGDGLEKQEGSALIDGEKEKAMDKEEKMRRKKLKETAKLSRAKFHNPTSDALTIAYALQCFELSRGQADFCNENALHLKTMEEMSKLRKQLLQLVFSQRGSEGEEFSWTHGTAEDVELAWRVSFDRHPLLLNEEGVLGRAICAGWADRVAKRTRGISVSSEGDSRACATRYQACMVKETVFLHRWSSLSSSAPEFLVYSELLQTKRPYMHGATSVKSDWLIKYAGSLCSFSAPLTDPKPFYDSRTDRVLSWVKPAFGPLLWELPLHSLPISDETHRVAVFAYALLEGQVLPCLKSARKFIAAPPATILRPEGSSQKRVGNLLFKLKAHRIDCCARLRDAWEENPMELHSEVQDWFQEGFQDQFEELWSHMLMEAQLESEERFPKREKRDKKRLRR